MLIFILKWLPFLGKLSFFSKFLAFIPGGQVFALIGSAISAALSAVAWFVKWLVADITDALKEPQRLLVRMIFGISVLCFGWWLGFGYAKDEVESARNMTKVVAKQRDVAKAENADWRERYATEKKKAEEAIVARAAAEATIRGAAAKRVRDGAGSTPAAGKAKKPAEPGLPSFSTLFGSVK
jgi:hypothetical protein